MIDARVVNHMDPETKIVHHGLEAWGRWAKSSESQAWPSTTVLGRIIEEGPHGAQSASAPPVSMPEGVAIYENAILHLGEIDQRVIKTYYMHWAPEEIMARMARLPLRRFKSVLRRARWRVSGYVSAASQFVNGYKHS